MNRINTNIAAFMAHRSLNMHNERMYASLRNLSTGLRVESAKDDPACLVASNQMRSEIVGINADATRQRDIIIGQANANALEREQSTRATMYKRMRDHLGWSGKDFLSYIKMKALNAQPSSNVVVGVNAVGSVAPS